MKQVPYDKSAFIPSVRYLGLPSIRVSMLSSSSSVASPPQRLLANVLPQLFHRIGHRLQWQHEMIKAHADNLEYLPTYEMLQTVDTEGRRRCGDDEEPLERVLASDTDGWAGSSGER